MPSPLMRRVGAALLVGATVGVTEAVWVLRQLHAPSASDVALLYLYACVSYGAAAAVLAACAVAARQRHAQAAPSSVIADAIGAALTVYLSAHLVSRLARLGQPRLAWLVPGCVLSALAVALLARWLVARVAVLRAPVTWRRLFAGLSALFVVVAVRAPLRGAAASRHAETRSPAGAPSILLISVDTLRSDRLGCYGSARARTPRIDALAREGVLFEQATSPIPLTGPSHTTMLTGLYPLHHGARDNGVPLRADVITVPEQLERAGYRTAAFVSGWTLKDAAVGLASRFDHYDEDFAAWPLFPDVVLRVALPQLVAQTAALAGHPVEAIERPGARTTARALAWLSAHRDAPFFAFVHYFDPHGPHAPPPPYDTMHDPDYAGDRTQVFSYRAPLQVRQRILADARAVEHVKALYDGEISYTDHEVGTLLDGLAAAGVGDHTVVIFTADHGESLTEHDSFFTHGRNLYDTCVHVPLLLRFPAQRYAGRRERRQVGSIDLAPTVLQLAGVTPAGPVDGHSLLPLLDGAAGGAERVSFGATQFGQRGNARANYYVRAGGHKLIWNFDRRDDSRHLLFEELYDLGTDPLEEHNLIGTSPPILEALRAQLHSWADEKAPAQPDASDAVKERLRALGY